MKKILLGVLIGIFICASFFEFIHKTVEIDGSRICAVIHDKLTEKWHGNFVYQLRVIYKIFTFPVKTTWILFSEDEIATSDGFGKEGCKGNWKVKGHGYND